MKQENRKQATANVPPDMMTTEMLHTVVTNAANWSDRQAAWLRREREWEIKHEKGFDGVQVDHERVQTLAASFDDLGVMLRLLIERGYLRGDEIARDRVPIPRDARPRRQARSVPRGLVAGKTGTCARFAGGRPQAGLSPAGAARADHRAGRAGRRRGRLVGPVGLTR